jgi:ATP-binding cassette, subfamily B, bacterial PglK
MITILRQAIDLVVRDRPSRWAALVALAIVVSGFEMVGAVLVYALIALVIDPAGDVELPLIGDLGQRFAGAEERSLLLKFVVIVAVFVIVRAGVKVGATYLQSRVAHNAGARLSNRLVEGYLRWPYVTHLQRHSSELIRNGYQAVFDLVNQVVIPLIKVVAESILLLGMVVVLMMIAPLATLMAILVVGSGALILLFVVQPRLKQLGALNHSESRAALGSLQQSLHGIRDIQVFGRTRYFAQQYGRSRTRLARAQYLNATAWQLPTIVIETALLGFILLFFALALVRGDSADGTLSVLGLFAYVGLRLQPSLRDIVAGLNSLKYSAAPLEDLHRDLASIAAYEEAAQEAVDPLPFRECLELAGVSFRYPGSVHPAVSGIDLRVRPGEQVGICGPTGGGKSTIVDLIIGLLEPSDGRVTVDGQDLRGHTAAWQRNLGIVSQMVFLIDDTLRRNIGFGVPDAAIDEVAVADAVRDAQLEELVASLPEGLETRIGERGLRLSGGQRQRVAIARALYGRPSVLVFDEGTSALDNQTERELMRAIDRLRGRHTIILVAHRLTTVRHADQVLFVEGGRITGRGSYADLARRHPSFRRMAGVEVS